MWRGVYRCLRKAARRHIDVMYVALRYDLPAVEAMVLGGMYHNPQMHRDHQTARPGAVSFFVKAKILGKELPTCMATQAYLKVHGGPAPQCAPSSRAVANRGGDGAGRPPHKQLLFLV